MIVHHSKGEYPIEFRKNIEDLDVVIGPDSVIVTDANVKQILDQHHVSMAKTLTLPAGEETKTMDHYVQVVEWLAGQQVKRSQSIFAIGGGVIGDLVGFAAASYMRGIPFVQIPTTLLAQVDSSVGGKVGIDLNAGKNLVGAFHPPTAVWVVQEFLNTLPEREFRSGMAEVIKYGFILDSDLYQRLNQPLEPRDPGIMPIIERSIDLKRQTVEADEFETNGVRAKLNFGHTIGHAIEKLTNYAVYTHGEAISIGMRAEARLSDLTGFSNNLEPLVVNQLQTHGLPKTLSQPLDANQLLATMRLDKKNDQAGINFSLVSSPGNSQLVKGVDPDTILEALKSI